MYAMGTLIVVVYSLDSFVNSQKNIEITKKAIKALGILVNLFNGIEYGLIYRKNLF